jgi:hypothetical protein
MSEAVVLERRRVILKSICKMTKLVEEQASQLESRLFHSSTNLEEYSDELTLKSRLKNLVRSMKAEKEQMIALNASQSSQQNQEMVPIKFEGSVPATMNSAAPVKRENIAYTAKRKAPLEAQTLLQMKRSVKDPMDKQRVLAELDKLEGQILELLNNTEQTVTQFEYAPDSSIEKLMELSSSFIKTVHDVQIGLKTHAAMLIKPAAVLGEGNYSKQLESKLDSIVQVLME